MQFSPEAWRVIELGLIQTAVLPGIYWVGRKVGRSVVSEITEAIDSRADAIAVRRDQEMKSEVAKQINHLDIAMAEHERKDVERFEELRTLIGQRRAAH